MLELWVDKYLPNTFDDYVWRDEHMKAKFSEYLEIGSLPHLLLSGRPGSGKTSLAKMMMHLLQVPEADILFIKASSRDRKIEEMESKISNFVSSYPMIDNQHGIKYVILDEADSLSKLTQKFLRSEMEHYSSTVRFILTCNYPSKIEDAIISRCIHYQFMNLSQEEFVLRVYGILTNENVEVDTDILGDYINKTYPDLRSCIGELQKNTIKGVLNKETSVIDHLDLPNIIEQFKQRKYDIGRHGISQINSDEYQEVYRYLYENVEIFAQIVDNMDKAYIIIRDGLYKHEFVCDPEINLSATIVELCMLERK